MEYLLGFDILRTIRGVNNIIYQITTLVKPKNAWPEPFQTRLLKPRFKCRLWIATSCESLLERRAAQRSATQALDTEAVFYRRGGVGEMQNIFVAAHETARSRGNRQIDIRLILRIPIKLEKRNAVSCDTDNSMTPNSTRANDALASGSALEKHHAVENSADLGPSRIIDSARTPLPMRFIAGLGEEAI
jgi:hypothetical protein